MAGFLSRCRRQLAPRHKLIAQQAINTANEAIKSLGETGFGLGMDIKA